MSLSLRDIDIRRPLHDWLWRSHNPPDDTVSEGEQQILSLARAVLGGASVLLLDEPTAGLSPKVSMDIADEIVGLSESFGLLVVIAEHNVVRATKICTDFYALKDGMVTDFGPTSELAADTDRVREIFL